jgi:hypothetical protein
VPRQNKLGEAPASLNPIRTRDGLLPLTLTAMTQQQAIDAILHERRLEQCPVAAIEIDVKVAAALRR